MNVKTPQEAAVEWFCPLVGDYCKGAICAMWQWVPQPASVIAPAVKARMTETGDKHKEAVAWVMDNREALGIPVDPTHGYCGPRGLL